MIGKTLGAFIVPLIRYFLSTCVRPWLLAETATGSPTESPAHQKMAQLQPRPSFETADFVFTNRADRDRMGLAEQCLHFAFIDHRDAQLFRLVEFGAGVGSGNDIICLFAD